MSKNYRKHVVSAAAASALATIVGLGGHAQAAPYTWTGTNGDTVPSGAAGSYSGFWSNAGNWNPSSGTPGSADAVTFQKSGTTASPTIVDLGGGLQQAASVTIQNPNATDQKSFALSNGTLATNSINLPYSSVGGSANTFNVKVRALDVSNGTLALSSGQSTVTFNGFAAGTYKINFTVGATTVTLGTSSSDYTGDVSFLNGHTGLTGSQIIWGAGATDGLGKGNITVANTQHAGVYFSIPNAYRPSAGKVLTVGLAGYAEGRVRMDAVGAVNADVFVKNGILQYAASNALDLSKSITLDRQSIQPGSSTFSVMDPGSGKTVTMGNVVNVDAGSVVQLEMAANRLTTNLSRWSASNTTGLLKLQEDAVVSATSSAARAGFTNLGTNADLYAGFGNNLVQDNFVIGQGTAYKGIAGTAFSYNQDSIPSKYAPSTGTTPSLRVTAGTTDIYLMNAGSNPTSGRLSALSNGPGFAFGNGATAGYVKIVKDADGTAWTGNVHVKNYVTLDEADVGGVSGVSWVVEKNGWLRVAQSNGLTDSKGVTVEDGGTLIPYRADSLNADVTIKSGGRLGVLAYNATGPVSFQNGLKGAGTVTLQSGAILEVNQADAFKPQTSPAVAQAVTGTAGTIVRLNAAGTALNSAGTGLSLDPATIYVLNATQAVSGETFNLSGGTITNAGAALTMAATDKAFVLSDAAKTDIFAATSGFKLTVAPSITGAGKLQIGSSSQIDGRDKMGHVLLNNSGNTFSGDITIANGVLEQGNAAALGNSANAVEFNGKRAIYYVSAGTPDRTMKLTTDGILDCGSLAISGKLTGQGTLIKQGGGSTASITSATNDLTGKFVVRGGYGSTGNGQNVISLAGTNGAAQLNTVSEIQLLPTQVAGADTLKMDNSTDNSTNRLKDDAKVVLGHGALTAAYSGGTTAAKTYTGETIGDVVLAHSFNGLQVSSVSTGAGSSVTWTANKIERNNGATMNFAGGATGSVFKLKLNSTAGLLAGSGGGAGTKTMSIIPFAVGASALNVVDSLLTYESNTVRALAPGEYAAMSDSGDTNNVKESFTSDVTLPTDKKVNAAILVNNAGTAKALTLTVGNTFAPQSGTLLFSANSTNKAQKITLSGGTLQFSTTEGVLFNGLNGGGAVQIDSKISGGGGLTFSTAGYDANATAGNMVTGQFSLTNAANDYTGTTTVNVQKLVLGSASGSSSPIKSSSTLSIADGAEVDASFVTAENVLAGKTLKGYGKLTSTAGINLPADATINPGFDVAATGPVAAAGFAAGKLTLNGGTLNGTTLRGTLSLDVAGTIAPGYDYDQVAVTGTVDVTGATLSLTGLDSSKFQVGDNLGILDNDASDAIVGTFAGLPQGTRFSAAGAEFTISYVGNSVGAALGGYSATGGNDIVLTVAAVPEPGSFGLLALGGLSLLARRRQAK